MRKTGDIEILRNNQIEGTERTEDLFDFPLLFEVINNLGFVSRKALYYSVGHDVCCIEPIPRFIFIGCKNNSLVGLYAFLVTF